MDVHEVNCETATRSLSTRIASRITRGETLLYSTESVFLNLHAGIVWIIDTELCLYGAVTLTFAGLRALVEVLSADRNDTCLLR